MWTFLAKRSSFCCQNSLLPRESKTYRVLFMALCG